MEASKKTIERCSKLGSTVSTEIQSEYSCARCDTSCPTKSLLIRHMSVTHSSELNIDGQICEAELSTLDIVSRPALVQPKCKFNCSKCPKRYSDSRGLREHSLKIHGCKDPPNYTCVDCGKIFSKLHSFTLHSRIHKPPPFSCSKCDRKFFSKPGMLLHKRAIHLRNKPTDTHTIPSVSCQQCSAKFISTEAMIGHLKRIHQPQEHKCPHCYNEFTTKGELNFHLIKAHSIPVEKNLKCNVCHKEFKCRRSMANHVPFHSNPTLSCSHCPLKYYTPAHLSQHIKRCHTNVVRFPMPPITNSNKVLNYSCAVCCKPFVAKNFLQQHLTTHYPKAQICPVCHQQFNSGIVFEAHMRQKHPETRESCGICNKAFSNRETYLRHKRFHDRRTQANIKTSLLGHSKSQNRLQPTTQGTNYDCPICGKEFSNPSNFSSHLLVHQKNKFDCSKCPKTSGSRRDLRRHYLSQHGIDEPTSYECGDCGGIFTSSHSLTLHSATHKPPQFSCNECDRKFFNWTSMFSHKKIVHFGKKTKVPLNKSEHPCEKCPMKFQTKTTLKTHMSNIHLPKEHKCSHCYKEFSMVWKLNTHLLKAHSISVESVFKCEICHKKCKDQAGLVSHSRFHGNPTLSCAQCPLTFYTASLLSLHVKRIHTVRYTMPVKTDSKEVNYTCSICCRPFGPKRESLKEHLRIHYYKAQFCQVCQKTFNSERIFKRHIRQTHPDSRATFDCGFCYKNFPTQVRYQMHMIHHKRPTLACPDCPLLFYNKSSVRYHSKSHNSKSKSKRKGKSKCSKTFACAIGLRKFPLRCLAKDHLTNTHNPTVFGCSKCDFQCYVKSGLTKHFQNFHVC